MKSGITKFRATQQMQCADFEIYHYRDPYFKPLDFHSHDFYEIYVFLDGSVTYYIEDRIYRLCGGDILVIAPGKMHRPVINDAGAAYERMVLWLDVNYLQGLDGEIWRAFLEMEAQREHLISLSQEDFAFAVELLGRLQALRPDDSALAAVLQRSAAGFFCGLLARQRIEGGAARKTEDASDTVPGVIRYINAHLDEELTLDSICAEFFVSKFHLIRKFKEYTNATVYDYIVSKRIAYAKKLLRQGETAARTAALCGFLGYSNFYRAFVAKTGTTPKKFKELCRISQE